jgi:hypothetical protein
LRHGGSNCRLDWGWHHGISGPSILVIIVYLHLKKKLLSILYERFEIIGYLRIEKKQCKKEYDSRKLVDCTPSLGLTKNYYKS